MPIQHRKSFKDNTIRNIFFPQTAFELFISVGIPLHLHPSIVYWLVTCTGESKQRQANSPAITDFTNIRAILIILHCKMLLAYLAGLYEPLHSSWATKSLTRFLWSWTWNMNKSEETSSFATWRVNHINYRITEQRQQKSKNRKPVGRFALAVHPAACLERYWWRVKVRTHRSLTVDPKTLPLPQHSSKRKRSSRFFILTDYFSTQMWHNWNFQTDALSCLWLFFITFLHN